MKKRTLALGLVLTLTLGLTPAMAAGVAEKFPNTRTYSGFSDVADNHWAISGIKACYETDLMTGKGAGFDPDGTVTVAEAAVVAARVGAALRGDTIPAPTDGVWYSAAAAYLRALPGGSDVLSGKLEQFSILRRGFLRYLSIAIPENSLATKNSITSLPDTNDPDVLRFYNAGVLTGVNDYGTFAQGRTLTRAEMSAMVSRIVRPETALSFTPKSKDAPGVDPIVYYTGYAGGTPAIVGMDGSVSLADYLTCYMYAVSKSPTSPPNDLVDAATEACLRSLWEVKHGTDTYPVGDLLGAKHILVDTKEEADAIRAQLKAAGDSEAKFDALMAQHSKDGRDASGNLYTPEGYTFGSGDMIAEFEAGTKALTMGQISQPIHGQYGYHIILRIPPNLDAHKKNLAGQAFSAWMQAQSFQYTDALITIDLPGFYESYTADLP